MSVHLTSFSSCSVFREQESSISNSLNSQEERISAVVLLTLGLLTAAYYVIRQRYFSAESIPHGEVCEGEFVDGTLREGRIIGRRNVNNEVD